MPTEEMIQKAAAAFTARFGTTPEATAYAPGRVNLLGEHTDYNGGLVLPMPLALGTAVVIGRSDREGAVTIASDAFDKTEMRRLSEKATGAWSDYVLGSIVASLKGGESAGGFNVLVATDLPLGSGLSSSAAIEVATLRAMAGLMGKSVDPVALAVQAREVENNFVGMPCGIMDQFCVSVGTPGEAILLDTKTLKHHPAPLPDGHNFVVIHSGVTHKLTDDGYATRVDECNRACQALGVPQLSDLSVTQLDRISALETPLNGRARHIVTENARVRDGLAALTAGNAEAFGALMLASHASQRDDYAVSVVEVDALVEVAMEEGATGARLTGGGFGGSVVALVTSDQVAEWSGRVTARCPGTRVLAVS